MDALPSLTLSLGLQPACKLSGIVRGCAVVRAGDHQHHALLRQHAAS